MNPTRRKVLSWLSTAPLAGLVTVERSGEATTYVLNECFIAGFRFHAGPSLLRDMEEGQSLDLIPEPTNPHDEYAVRVQLHGDHLGYVPREQNQTVSRLLDQGAPLECRITPIDREAPTWEQVRIQASITVRS